jgi:transcriptional regulator with XRE-family HTH domain
MNAFRAARDNAGLSLREVARQASISPALAHKIEGGYRSSAPTRKRVAKALGVDVVDLWPGLPTRGNRHGREPDSIARAQRRALAEPAVPEPRPAPAAPDCMIGTAEPSQPTPEEVFAS